MSALEDRVRAALRADAATVRPDTLPGVPERPTRPASGRASSRRVRILLPLGAAAAVAAIVTGIAVIAPHGGVPGPGQSAPSPAPSTAVLGLPLPVFGGGGQPASRGVPASAPSPGAPQYYVTVNEPSAVNSLVVRATASGTVVSTIDPPAGTAFGAIAATAGDRTFITAVGPAGNGCEYETRLYQFQLSDRGVPGPLTPLNIAVPGNNVQNGTLAITPDGSTIAYDTWLCGPNQDRFEVGVIDLATGQVRTWEVANQDEFTMGLSLSPDGTQLVYETLDGGAAILRTSASGGSLVAHSQVVSRSAGWAALTDNGSGLITCSVTSNAAQRLGSVTYYEQSLTGDGVPASASAGRRVIASWSDLPYPQCWASTDPSGGYLLIQYPVAVPNASDWVQPAVLDLQTGQLTHIAAPSFYGPADVAW